MTSYAIHSSFLITQTVPSESHSELKSILEYPNQHPKSIKNQVEYGTPCVVSSYLAASEAYIHSEQYQF